LDPEHGLDEYFLDKARKSGKTVVALEAVDFQIGLITGFSKEEGQMLLKDTLKDLEDTEKNFDEMVKDWKKGESTKLAKLLTEAFEDSPAIYKRLLTDRNERWVPKIEELLSNGRPAIIIVGAGHLVGKGGVLELLKNKGFKVTQL
jgi:hypothetical protein